MSLTYNILWVDDRKEDYQDAELDIELKKYLQDNFFTPNIIMCETVDTAEQFLNNTKFDVIFSDYNITEEKKGNIFISDIRARNINTEILFYSAQKELPISDFNRVTFCKLDSEKGYDELLSNMKNLINLTLEKLNDLTNLRGLVISEVSELENKMVEILLKYFKTSDPQINKNRREEFDLQILTPVENENKSKLINCPIDKNIETTDERPCKSIHRQTDITKIITDPDFGSFKKANSMKLVLANYNTPRIEKLFNKFSFTIIQERNKLAHSSTKIKDGLEVLITKSGDKIYDQNEIKKLRKHIKEYDSLFNEILEKVLQEPYAIS